MHRLTCSRRPARRVPRINARRRAGEFALRLKADGQPVHLRARCLTGFLLDENLPGRLRFTPSLPVLHARDLGLSLNDTDLWRYARERDLVIITKDTDFSERILVTDPPPKVVHLRFGNLRLGEFHDHLARVWPRVEVMLETNKLVNIYLEHLEAAA